MYKSQKTTLQMVACANAWNSKYSREKICLYIIFEKACASPLLRKFHILRNIHMTNILTIRIERSIKNIRGDVW